MSSARGVEPRRARTSEIEAGGLVRVARIARPHGIRGELRVTLDNPGSNLLAPGDSVSLASDGGLTNCRIETAHRAGRGVRRVKFEGIDSPEAAAALRDAIVYVRAEKLPALEAGEFYSYRAVGCDVVTTAGDRLGAVVEIFATGANDVMVVRDGGAEILVPVIEDVIKGLDFESHRITIEPLRGWLDSTE